MSIKRLGLRPEKSPLYNKAVIHGETVYLAGQVALDPTASAADQTRQVLAQIDDYLGRCGSSKSKLLTATVIFNDMKHYAEVNAVWDAWVDPQAIPTRTAFAAQLVTAEHLVAIQVTASL